VSFHMSVCSYVITYLPLSMVVCMITRIISCKRLAYFISIVVRIISCDISECSLYLYSLFEHLSVSFHLLVVCRCWLRPSIDTS